MWKGGYAELIPPYEARYSFPDYHVEVAVDVRNGKIFRLTAGSGYEGRLFGKISVPVPAKVVFALDPDFHYNEAEGLILCKTVPGICLEVLDPDPPLEEISEMQIVAISVFAAEMDSPEWLTNPACS